MHAQVHHQNCGKRSDKSCDRTHRQIYVARNNHQQHTQSHDDDVTVLENQIRKVQRFEQSAVGQDLE